MDEILDIKQAAQLVGDDTELLKELLQSFVDDKNLSMETLEELEAKPDTTEAAKYVHYFKGAGRQLCAQKLAAAGQKLEDVLRNKAEGNIKELNTDFYNAYVEAREAIEEALDIL